MKQGQYDLCIDDDKQVTRLTNHKWPSIEAGTTIVMRIVFEEETRPEVKHKCHFCGTVNQISAKYSQIGCSIICRKCKRRFQISNGGSRTTRSSIDSVRENEAEMHLIRNFHIQQIVCCYETSLAVLD
ncbi:uncharacterized protein EDB93DRAFT_1139246 [Suillus bovinus]|uniref:uncharacterized protein n=1 Tax=Suillus bovinus TaxID=48563 RepID=UPI001B871D1A|nr:uncharacterized protein EDB93DRAFT_1139246 [Suillus bovinus]KAG2151136.1 hypothetical protein EDB93DRAFT_1139246 [Suillus bovinus]